MRIKYPAIYLVLAGVVMLMCSYREGAALHGWDCTGGETGLGNAAGCSSGGGCHCSTPTPGIAVTIQLDSAGVPVYGYRAGLTYTILIQGVNNTALTLPRFGFQVAAFQGSVAETTPVNAGTFQQSSLPTGVHYQTPVNPTYTVANIVEQTTALTPDSGSGGTGTIYSESFNWTAPAAGTGTISFWGAINAVNNSNSADQGDKWNTQKLVVYEDTTSANTGIAGVEGKLCLTVYPNPVSDVMHLQVNNALPGAYRVRVFDVSGKQVMESAINITEQTQIISLAANSWQSGIYFMELTGNEGVQVIKTEKK